MCCSAAISMLAESSVECSQSGAEVLSQYMFFFLTSKNLKRVELKSISSLKVSIKLKIQARIFSGTPKTVSVNVDRWTGFVIPSVYRAIPY